MYLSRLIKAVLFALGLAMATYGVFSSNSGDHSPLRSEDIQP
jgi:hypothetical protein